MKDRCGYCEGKGCTHCNFTGWVGFGVGTGSRFPRNMTEDDIAQVRKEAKDELDKLKLHLKRFPPMNPVVIPNPRIQAKCVIIEKEIISDDERYLIAYDDNKKEFTRVKYFFSIKDKVYDIFDAQAEIEERIRVMCAPNTVFTHAYD